MKILITGGAGFIGSNFVHHALAEGHEIVNVDKLTYAGDLLNLKECESNPNYTFYQQDVCDRRACERVLRDERPDVLVHMAAESHVDRSIDNADDFVRTNVNGTHSLLEAALSYHRDRSSSGDRGFRFLHLSTDEVFGALGPNDESFREDSPYRPNSPYAASKASSDLLVRSYVRTHGLPAIVVNSSNNFGPRQFPEKLIPLTMLNALDGRPLPVYGDGTQVRDWLFVEDHVRALLTLAENGAPGETYCVGAENEMRNIDVVTLICDTLNELRKEEEKEEKEEEFDHKTLITHVKDRPGHDFRYAIDCSKIKRELGWRPRKPFKEAIRETVQWYVDFRNDPDRVVAHDRRRLGVR